jgi:ParB family chromosome partitioning protein
MTRTPINLDSLKAFSPLDAVAGKPLSLAIDRIHEDPGQPRKAFDPEALAELVASIKETGVRTPVSVKPHPTIAGDFVLNFGARRLRASREAGRTSIPAFIDELHTDYDQVVENLQRDGLSPMEMALFISSKIKSGAVIGDIARKLGLSPSAISKYMALVDAPSEIEAVYTTGRSTSPATLYELRGALETWPEETAAWIEAGGSITRGTVDALKKQLSASGAQGGGKSSDASRVAKSASKPAPKLPVSGKPTLLVMILKRGDRTGVLLLEKPPLKMSDILLRWDDTGQVEEVPANTLQIEGMAER